jgi:hypothetical protein
MITLILILEASPITLSLTLSRWIQMMRLGDESSARCDEAKGRGLDKYQAQ